MDRNDIVLFKAIIGMEPHLRFIVCVTVLVLLLPVAALGIVSGGQTIDGKISVTYSPNKPVVGQPLTLLVTIDNTGTTDTTYRLCYQEQGSPCNWYTFLVKPKNSQKYNIKYEPKATGEVKFDFSLYWYQNNLQMVPLQAVTKTVPVYLSQDIPAPGLIQTVATTLEPTPSQPTTPPTTEKLIGFDVVVALLTIFAIIMLKKGR